MFNRPLPENFYAPAGKKYGVPMDAELSLQSRLRNCLQTILELKAELGAVSFGMAFMEDLGMIDRFLQKIDSVTLREADVERIEKATAVFLRELGGLFEKERPAFARRGHLRLQ